MVFVLASVDLRQIKGVADEGLFLKIANHPMCSLGCQEIDEEVEILENRPRPHH